MRSSPSIALLTGGSDKPYALGLAGALAARGIRVDFIGSNELDCPEVHAIRDLRFFNLRGDQREDVPFRTKFSRILLYYARLAHYAARARPTTLHILWNNRFEMFDRTVLMAYYRCLGNKVVLTAHNVNVAARNGSDSWLNRLSLRIQYRLSHHLFVHTNAMKRQLVAEFGVPAGHVTVIPFGINDTIPKTGLTRAEARGQLGLHDRDRVVLCFGQIAPYKGLEYLVEAIALLARRGESVRLIIAGKVKRGSEDYWSRIQRMISERNIDELVVQIVRFIPDEEVEAFFKATDAAVMPYVDIFQSGVPFLAFSFGVPVISTNVGALSEDVTRETGLLCTPRDPADLARAVSEFFDGNLYGNAGETAVRIRRFAEEQHSWDTVSELTKAVYENLEQASGELAFATPNAESSEPSKCQE